MRKRGVPWLPLPLLGACFLILRLEPEVVRAYVAELFALALVYYLQHEVVYLIRKTNYIVSARFNLFGLRQRQHAFLQFPHIRNILPFDLQAFLQHTP